MERDRSYRRHQHWRATQKSLRLLRDWGWLRPFRHQTEEEYREWAAHWVHLMTSTHRKPCSCTGCGNPRRHFGERTRPELKWALTTWEQSLEWEHDDSTLTVSPSRPHRLSRIH